MKNTISAATNPNDSVNKSSLSTPIRFGSTKAAIKRIDRFDENSDNLSNCLSFSCGIISIDIIVTKRGLR